MSVKECLETFYTLLRQGLFGDQPGEITVGGGSAAPLLHGHLLAGVTQLDFGLIRFSSHFTD